MKYHLNLSDEAWDFLNKLAPKQFKQIVTKMFSLLKNPLAHDSKKLSGVEGYRVDQGEFRILYTLKHPKASIEGEVCVWRIGKRNDGEVYRNL